jgi:hypothetical protein
MKCHKLPLEGEEIRAILYERPSSVGGRKSTFIRPSDDAFWNVGDVLRIQESFGLTDSTGKFLPRGFTLGETVYRADYQEREGVKPIWCPSVALHQVRIRLHLKVVGMRFVHAHDLTTVDAELDRADDEFPMDLLMKIGRREDLGAKHSMVNLIARWERGFGGLRSSRAWHRNPLVCVTRFEVMANG